MEPVPTFWALECSALCGRRSRSSTSCWAAREELRLPHVHVLMGKHGTTQLMPAKLSLAYKTSMLPVRSRATPASASSSSFGTPSRGSALLTVESLTKLSLLNLTSTNAIAVTTGVGTVSRELASLTAPKCHIPQASGSILPQPSAPVCLVFSGTAPFFNANVLPIWLLLVLCAYVSTATQWMQGECAFLTVL
jgi:hypothetical protein